METISNWLQETLGMSTKVQAKLLTSVILVLGLWIVSWLIPRIALWRTEDPRIRYRWKKAFGYFVFFLSIIVIGFVWLEEFQSIMTFLGLVSAGITIALKDPIVNFFGWAFIVFRRPLQVGDRIQIGDDAGDVIDIRLFQFTLMEIGNWVDADQSTGRIIHIPNGKIFTEPLSNYSRGFQYIWNEIPVLITFESNWEKAKNILSEVVNKHAEHLSKLAEKKVKEASMKYMIFYSKLTPTVYTTVKDSGVLLTIRYLCEPRKRRGSEQEIWENILKEFGRSSNIDFAYPTQRFYTPAQGKPAAPPPTENEEPENEADNEQE
ncbi:MAG: mechanosensitive ion channel family protein [Planctomycetota bacterium]|jgi:small-conductance mechanosensitive channel